MDIDKIAKDILNIDTLETRNGDSLDFHEVAVWSIKEALEEAYRAGQDTVQDVIKEMEEDVNNPRNPAARIAKYYKERLEGAPREN